MRGMRAVVAVAAGLLALGSGAASADSERSAPSASSETFSLPGGQLETRIYPAPINYRDGDGEWVPLDEDLQEGEASALANGQNSFDLALPDQLDAGAVRISTDDG
jgi:hypothetical protein